MCTDVAVGSGRGSGGAHAQRVRSHRVERCSVERRDGSAVRLVMPSCGSTIR